MVKLYQTKVNWKGWDILSWKLLGQMIQARQTTLKICTSILQIKRKKSNSTKRMRGGLLNILQKNSEYLSDIRLAHYKIRQQL